MEAIIQWMFSPWLPEFEASPESGPFQTTEVGLSSRKARFAMNFFRDDFRASSADYSPDFGNLAATKCPWKADTPTSRVVLNLLVPRQRINEAPVQCYLYIKL